MSGGHGNIIQFELKLELEGKISLGTYRVYDNQGNAFTTLFLSLRRDGWVLSTESLRKLLLVLLTHTRVSLNEVVVDALCYYRKLSYAEKAALGGAIDSGTGIKFYVYDGCDLYSNTPGACIASLM
ncbi:MAG: hypothetical protein AB203_03425 [Parcubacteria bacterium C7867-008]|nr:MAG: hypothetical protein AB203_03425 [Parcubacteria bacterium C7867-008]